MKVTVFSYPFRSLKSCNYTDAPRSTQPHKNLAEQFQVEMIIKSLFRRNERWNPVHPTNGAFWGIGIGIGCGVGWGPGFGPEVIGYVGAGCGAGFNVGFTLFGIGIGLPANYLLAIPHWAFMVARRGVVDGNLSANRSSAEDGWGANRLHISDVRQIPCPSFSGFKIDSLAENIRDLPEVKSMLVSHAKHMTGCLQRVTGGLFYRDTGPRVN